MTKIVKEIIIGVPSKGNSKKVVPFGKEHEGSTVYTMKLIVYEDGTYKFLVNEIIDNTYGSYIHEGEDFSENFRLNNIERNLRDGLWGVIEQDIRYNEILKMMFESFLFSDEIYSSIDHEDNKIIISFPNLCHKIRLNPDNTWEFV